jgi:Kae1-associated kinase Bud32
MTDTILYQGAEAILTKTTFHQYRAVEKRRISKSYRIPEIDRYLISYRTKEEAKLISEARTAGVSVPLLYDINLKNGIIIMEYIDGPRVKDVLNSKTNSEQQQLCKLIGENIGHLHNHELIHGDLTTSNMIIQGQQIFFIDFGLGSKSAELEMQGVDLHVLMEAFESTHSQHPQLFEWVLDGYRKCYNQNVQSVEHKIQDIVKRGRYR